MEPGDLRINARIRDEGGVPKGSPGHVYTAAPHEASVLHFRNHGRPGVISDGRLHHVPSPMPGVPFVFDNRHEPVTIWRDPSLMNSSEVRHVVSMQHSGVVQLAHQHPMVAHHGNVVSTGGSVYQHHDNKPLDTTSRGHPHPQSAPEGMRGRPPAVYAPGPPPPHPQHPQHPPQNAKPTMDAWRGGPAPPAVLQNSKDFRVNLTANSTVEQAVCDHFVESLRLAHLKGSTPQPPPVPKQEERPNSYAPPQMQQYYQPRTPEKRHHEIPSPQVMYQMHQQHHQQQALAKPELPAPPPLRSEQHRPPTSVDSGRKQHQIYGPPDVVGRGHDTPPQQQSSIRYEPEPMSRHDVLPSENCVRYQKLPPAPRRPTAQSDLQQLERNRSPFGKPPQVTPTASPNAYHAYPQAHLSKHKVNSPAPPHIYGKPGPSTRPYDMNNDPSVPLPLTSKGGLTRPSQSSPTSYAHTSPTLPQHDVRKADVAYYMYNNGPPGFQPPSMSPQAHLHSIQTQPLDLGGKRKVEEPPEVYKGPIPEYSDHTSSMKPLYGSRKPIVDDPRPKMTHSHHQVNNLVPLSLTVAEVASKRKIEDTPMHVHLDTKKVRSDSAMGVAPGLPTNFMYARKDHDLKPPPPGPPEFLPEPSRSYADNLAPISLITSGSDIKVKPEVNLTPPLEIKKSTIHIGAAETTPVYTTTIVPTPTALCNGRHKDAPPQETMKSVITSSAELQRQMKAEPAEVAPVIVEPRSSPSLPLPLPPPPPPAVTSAPTPPVPSTSTSSSFPTPSSAPTKFQKVPKKAWVLQWHEGDGVQEKEEEKIIPKASPAESEVASSAAPGTSTTTTSTATGDSQTPPEKSVPTEEKDKMLNGHTPVTTPAVNETEENPSTTTTTAKAGPQSVNGFGKERLNESDIGSENESDNSGKEKALTDSTASPAKKLGRKGKEGAPSKSDLRKDGLCKRPPVTQLKKTGESFIQAETCNRVTPKIGKCRECRWHPSGRGSKKQSGAYCRFYGFRKLRYTKGGSLTVAGFSDPFSDPSKITEHDQFRLWLPSNVAPEGLDVEMSKFLVSRLCDQFCDLVEREEEARAMAEKQETSVISWKPLLKGVREMCDVCDTTLFNFHWACGKCGFVVCLGCFKARQDDDDEKMSENNGKDRDEYQWLLCSNRCPHELDKLMLVQTIAGDALRELNTQLHAVCTSWKISQDCGCSAVPKQDDTTGDSEIKTNSKSDSESPERAPKDTDSEGKSSSDHLKQGTSKRSASSSPTRESSAVERGSKSASKTANGDQDRGSNEPGAELNNFKRQPATKKLMRGMKHLIQKVFGDSESNKMFPSVKHSWVCDGQLLRLLEPLSSDNTPLFHELWKRGQPVLVSNVAAKLDESLWTPDSFSKDFGDYKNDLVDCITGKVVGNHQMKKFWDGFSSVSKRIRDENGEPMILKLKDWPPTDDFAQTLPSRFQDLMAALPLPDYTLREGKHNLVTRLPAEFMRPDLGPKMYIAYDSSSVTDKATTNLHLDVSDAVNVLVHCEAPQDVDSAEHDKAVMNAIEEADCDDVTISRVTQSKEVPGALWHIYNAKDADKIRDLLNKVAKENGAQVEPHHDAIHDQKWYLDKSLRKRLRSEYDVSEYSILQCAGDAIFIPAGAPHQVRNLQNCIKVTEDFLSPENISHSLYLAEVEFRHLNKALSHSHEDKLQLKNVVYHALKDAVSVLQLQNSEKSELTSQDPTSVEASSALSKDCQPRRSTSPKEPAAAIVNSTTN